MQPDIITQLNPIADIRRIKAEVHGATASAIRLELGAPRNGAAFRSEAKVFSATTAAA